MKLALASVMVVPLLCIAQEAERPLPVEQEPLHKIEFKNDQVTVLRLKLPPGQYTQYHIHRHDRVAIQLSATSTTQQDWGQAERAPNVVKPGDFAAMTLQGDSYTHRVHNVGAATYDVIDIEFAHRPSDPSSAPAAAVAAENPSARIYNWPLAPGAATPMHAHKRPYVIVSVTAFDLKMDAPDGQSNSHTVGAGDFHYVDGNVTHSLTNAGATPGQIVEVELK